ncbi:uncharacterized protein T551_03558 [Pneumocystis jirovecii RU7]|uniref:SGF29 C-terminal domain-containing protein n=1 Tax=Pneumocystis jirovecii (strain RU7) TaxID=1408657 RepID=A0A0W4ZD31_PNEJ7|nr:uncharacterized protein T551_03558 [Pneumocystis jirovecii RU7]KTW26259.1 hypothetical protein T551_03558 [Pneumocystis jirovecii RU7]
MSRARHFASTEGSEEMRVWLKIVKYIEQYEKYLERENMYRLDIKKIQEKIVTETNITSIKTLQNTYRAAFETVNSQQNLLLQMQESLDILIALQDSRRRKRRADEQAPDLPIFRAKKSRNQTAKETLQIGSQVKQYLRKVKHGYLEDLNTYIVAFRQPKTRNNQGDWIQCIITRIIGEGSKIRYEVQDPEPDEHHHSGQIYRTVASNLILIPSTSAGLRPLSPGRQVLARYPETTTFYNAQRDGTCKLRFEGEVGKETEVERKLVLEVNQ